MNYSKLYTLNSKLFLKWYCFIRKKVLILHPFYTYEKQMLNKQHNLLLIKWIH